MKEKDSSNFKIIIIQIYKNQQINSLIYPQKI
jgi:hypothetical protein